MLIRSISIIAIPVSCMIGLLVGCAHLKPIATDTAQCAMGEVPSALVDLEQQASASMFGLPGAQPWDSFAKSALLEYGMDAAKCVVLAVLHQVHLGLAQHGEPRPAYVRAAKIGQEWMYSHGDHRDQ